jgi:hypothetical protein
MHSLALAWQYCSQRVVYAQAAGQKEEIWPALLRLLRLIRLYAKAEAGTTVTYELQFAWLWPDGIRLGLADPSLTFLQLRECLRLLPTDKEITSEWQRAAKIDFAEGTLPRLQPQALSDFFRDYSKETDYRRFYCGNLDAAEVAGILSKLVAGNMRAMEMSIGKGRAYSSAVSRAIVPTLPELPWPDPKAKLRSWYAQFAFRVRMRGIHNSMLAFFPQRGSVDLTNIGEFRFPMCAARLYVASRIFEKLHGAKPKTLDDLLADGILPAMPTDPYSGRDLLYDGNRIWSVGRNLVDDGGSAARDSSGRSKDLVWDPHTQYQP